ncbi:5-methyltetrahydropteroyltriglutamate--homocysteine S-methyltransferase, partial [Mycobacterium sp. CBMA361]|nr:5-methyltetrahydropteroyltriglutamate--homocysteine S-methyltransferase [Mycolicibacterium sp. CBMA 361]
VALRDGREKVAAEIEASNQAVASRTQDPRLHNDDIRARLQTALAGGIERGPAAERRKAQDSRLNLPALPTTTIGSFPQTVDIRKARAALVAGEIDDAEYTDRMKAEVETVIRLQEDLGLDVLVHGEPERNDMVQYFAEQLDG